MKIHISIRFEGHEINHSHDFESQIKESEIDANLNALVQSCIAIIKVKCSKEWHEDFMKCVFFEVWTWEQNIKKSIFRKEKQENENHS